MEIAGYGWNTSSGYRIIPEFSSLTKISAPGQEIRVEPNGYIGMDSVVENRDQILLGD
jgi:hypothetical protein